MTQERLHPDKIKIDIGLPRGWQKVFSTKIPWALGLLVRDLKRAFESNHFAPFLAAFFWKAPSSVP
jgi:hypothetical protein